MKRIVLGLALTAVVVGLQMPGEKIAFAVEDKQEVVATQMKRSDEVSKEESSKNAGAEKPVDSTTESTKKKNKN